jgi:hypothetical protein
VARAGGGESGSDVHVLVMSAILVLQYPARREKMWSQPKCTNKRTVSFLLDFSPTRLKFYPMVGKKSTQHCSLWKCDETSKVIPYFDLIKRRMLSVCDCVLSSPTAIIVILPLQLSLRPSQNALARALAGMFDKTPTAAKKRHHNFSRRRHEAFLTSTYQLHFDTYQQNSHRSSQKLIGTMPQNRISSEIW